MSADRPDTPPYRSLDVDLDDSIERLAVVSDLHGYREPLEAFDALRAGWNFSYRIAVNGDLVMGGADPEFTVAWTMKNAGELATAGNHDLGALRGGACPDEPPFTEGGAWARLSEGQRAYLRELPGELRIRWRGRRVRILHGHVTPKGEGSAWRSTPDQLWSRFGDPRAAVTCLGHTHFSFVLEKNGARVANSGSLGYTILENVREDGSRHCMHGPCAELASADTRPSFLMLMPEGDGLRVEVVRFETDRRASLERVAEWDLEAMRFWERRLMEGVVDERLRSRLNLARPWR